MAKQKIAIGEVAHKAREENKDNTTWVEVAELQREMQKNFMGSIEECVKRHSQWKEPWYIVVMTARHADNPNVIYQRFIGRRTRPKPSYDTSLFKYTPSTGDLHYCWTVPDRGMVAEYVRLNASDVLKEEEGLWKMANAFAKGQLI